MLFACCCYSWFHSKNFHACKCNFVAFWDNSTTCTASRCSASLFEIMDVGDLALPRAQTYKCDIGAICRIYACVILPCIGYGRPKLITWCLHIPDRYHDNMCPYQYTISTYDKVSKVHAKYVQPFLHSLQPVYAIKHTMWGYTIVLKVILGIPTFGHKHTYNMFMRIGDS